MRWARSAVALATAVALSAAACSQTLNLGGESWTVDCQVVSVDDCTGAAGLFVNNLARNTAAIREDSGAHLTVSFAACPTLDEWPAWARPGECWRVEAPTTSIARACMILARSTSPNGYGFGRVAGDQFTGLAFAPDPGTTPC